MGAFGLPLYWSVCLCIFTLWYSFVLICDVSLERLIKSKNRRSLALIYTHTHTYCTPVLRPSLCLEGMFTPLGGLGNPRAFTQSGPDSSFTRVRLSVFFPQPHERECVWPVGIVRHEIKHRKRSSSRPCLSTQPNNESNSFWDSVIVLRSSASFICGTMSVMLFLDLTACDFWSAKTGCIDPLWIDLSTWFFTLFPLPLSGGFCTFTTFLSASVCPCVFVFACVFVQEGFSPRLAPEVNGI